MSRSTRTLIAVLVFVIAGFMITNLLVSGSRLDEWLLPVILLGIGLVLVLYPTGETAEAEAEAPAESLPATQPKPALAASATPEPAPVATETATVVDDSQPDDLTKIEGIGKKMSAALVASNIATFATLANTSEDDLRAAIKAAGMRFAPSVPTWAKQSAYAASSDWDGLQAYQDTLVGGREPG